MKFTITREQLQEGLAAVAAAIPAKTTLPVLANVLVEASKQSGGLRLSGTDLDIAVSTTVPAEVDADGAVTLPAKKLVDIARELPSGPVRVTAAGEARVSIESGRSKFKLLGLPREEYPSFPAVKFEKAWKAAAGVVHKLVGHVAFAASTEESRPILNGGRWELRPDRMRMVATNGHRLAKMDVPATGGSTADLIVPPKALEQIRRLYPGDAEIELAKSDNHIGFRAGGTLVFSRLIEGPYPNYEQVIPRENDKQATIDKLAMAAALRRMSVVASDQTHRIRLVFGGRVRDWRLASVVARQNQIATRLHLGRPIRRIGCPRLRQRRRECRGLRGVEPRGWDGEVRFACCRRAPHARSPLHAIQVELHDAVFAQRHLEPDCRHRFFQFAQHC